MASLNSVGIPATLATGNMEGLDRKIQQHASELATFLKNDAIDIIEVEGLNHIEEAFDNEGFTDGSLRKWRKRKARGQTYKTNRRGRAGQLTAAGRADAGRAILTGHGSGGNKLRNSFRAERSSEGVRFATDKEYAQRHNEGLKGMPKRQFMGKSKELSRKVMLKINKQINLILKT